jgi:hypothetical protein
MTQTTTFQDVLTQLSFLWEKSRSENNELNNILETTKYSLDEQCKVNDKLQQENKGICHELLVSQREVDKLKKKVQEAEDDQKQFTKVSHIINMERENTHYKQQIAILERRVAFYQNQCNELKSQTQSQTPQSTQATQTCIDDNSPEETSDELLTNSPHQEIEAKDNEDRENIENIDNIEGNEDNEDSEDSEDLSVVEKKIKGVIYYVSDENDIYERNEDESIGELKGKIEVLSSGKTKVKWYK